MFLCVFKNSGRILQYGLSHVFTHQTYEQVQLSKVFYIVWQKIGRYPFLFLIYLSSTFCCLLFQTFWLIYVLSYIPRRTNFGYLYRNPDIFNSFLCFLLIGALSLQIISQLSLSSEVYKLNFIIIFKQTKVFCLGIVWMFMSQFNFSYCDLSIGCSQSIKI